MAMLYTNTKSSPLSENTKIVTHPSYSKIIPIFLALITFITYLPSLWYEFHFDDKENILKFFAIRHATFKELCFSSPRWISKWLNTLYYKIGEFNPVVYRLAGISFHIITGVVLFTLIYRLLSYQNQNQSFKKYALIIATITSSLFLLHPVQTQTVSYVIQGQLEGLSALATLTSLLFFYHYCISTRFSKKLGYGIAIIVSVLVGCGTKEMFIITPILLILVDWFFIAEGSIVKCISRIWLYCTTSLLISVLFYYFSTLKVFALANQAYNNFGNALTIDGTAIIGRYDFFISQFKVILHYIQICIVPYGMSVDYDWKMSQSFFASDALYPFMTLVILALITLYFLIQNKQNIFAFAILWFFVSILPRASIIPACELVADYKTYLASIGVFFIIALLTVMGIERLQKYSMYLHVFIALLSSPIVLISYATYSRNLVWSSEKVFWADIIEKAPLKARGHNNYGTALQDSNEYEQSLVHFKRAIELDAKYPDPLINSSISYNKLGNIDSAIESIEKALELSKYQPEAYLNYGLFLHTKERYPEAKRAFTKAIELRPYYGKAWHNLALVEAETGNYTQAIEAAQYACLKSDYLAQNSFLIWARAALAIKEYDSAIAAYKGLLQINPHSIDTTVQLAQCYIFKKSYLEAFELYQQILQVITDNPFIWHNNAECALHLEKYTDAIHGYAITLQLMPSMTQAAIKLAICYDKIGDQDKAEAVCKKIIADYPPKEIMTQAQSLIKKLQNHSDRHSK